MVQEKTQVVDFTDEAADEIFEALTASTTRRVLSLVYEKPLMPTDIRDELETSLQNAHYHLEKLEEVDLIEPSAVGYSEKGTEMTVYGPTNEAIVLFEGVSELKQEYLNADSSVENPTSDEIQNIHAIQNVDRLNNITVEYKDLYNKMLGETPIVEASYRYVDILSSGWLRCVDPDEERATAQEEVSVDYLPFQRVNQVRTVSTMVDDDECESQPDELHELIDKWRQLVPDDLDGAYEAGYGEAILTCMEDLEEVMEDLDDE